MEEILLIDKPKGITSFAVVQRLRKELSIKKIGHAGTLDPNATGLLVVGVGSGTKKLKNLVGLDKVYEAEILLGTQTDTGDIKGTILKKVPVAKIDRKKLGDMIENLVGKHILPVSKYSATKIGGTPAYKLARQQRKVPNLKREMELIEARLTESKPHEDGWLINVELKVSSGTYIRSIAEEIGKKLGSPATLRNLRRTRVGNFDVANSRKV